MNAYDYAKKASGSFVLPDACFKVKKLIGDSSSTVEDFANVIGIDPAMTSRLLKIANSSIYSFPGQISTISRAITIIGTAEIYNMMLVDVAASAFKHFANQTINLQRFWRSSIYTGLAATNLAIKVGIKDVERLFVAGLLANFGQLVVANINAGVAAKIDNYQGEYLPWQVQKHLLGFTYTEVSAELLKIWQIPEKIILPIRHFNDGQVIQINNDVPVLYLASRLALIDCFSSRYSYEKLIDSRLFKRLALTENDLNEAQHHAQDKTDEVLTLMSVNMF
jgi:HD-like signal output (HDOD) protein